MPENDVIHVALAFSDPKGTYARHAAVTAASVYENARARRVSVHVLHDETLTPGNRSALEELARKYGQGVAFHDAGERFLRMPRKSRKRALQDNRGMMYRLFIPDMLDLSKVIYLDCDIVVNMDIAELWSQDLKGRALGAVRDVMSERFRGRGLSANRKRLLSLWKVDPRDYFNSGVLVMDLDKIRSRCDFMDSAVSFFEEYGTLAGFKDQDFLNWLFVNDTFLLEERFNRIDASGVTERSTGGSVWHFAGPKPWNSYTRPFVDDLYWRYLRLTPYYGGEDDLIRYLLCEKSASPLLHRHSSDCIGRLARQMKENILRPHATTARILWKCLRTRFARGRSRKIVS